MKNLKRAKSHILKILLFFLVFFSNHCFAKNLSDTSLLRSHLTTITKTPQFRTYKNIDQLNNTAAFIQSVFAKYSDTVWIQEYRVNGDIYKNVICSFGTQYAKRIIMGAHYDVCGDQPGADDNASGIVALLELSRLLKGQKLNHRVDLVAYSLEEPPYFETESMGSYIHAQSLKDSNISVYGMVSLEMIGYFRDEEKSQSYPVSAMSVIYGKKGDFITLVRKTGAGKFANRFTSHFKSAGTVKTKTFTAPKSVGAIGLSDHLNYWTFGYSALMVTDTSFYRNANYHKASDTMETLDINRMAKVIDGVYQTLLAM